MACIETHLNTEEYLRQFSRKAAELRIPVSGSLDLTYACNLNCIHCYLGPHDSRAHAGEEMKTDRLLSIIDEVAEAGCLYLLITGGEPLMRRDFPEIYRHAKEKGLIVTIFTNGTLITDRIIELFRDLPPHEVEITLYGATAPTYEKITSVHGSYEKCMQGIRKLLDNNIRLRLKTVLMTLNSHEFDAIEKIARDFGVKFRFDAAIFPRLNGDRSPLDLRVSPEYAIEKEFSDNKRSQGWVKYFERSKDIPPSDKLYICGAGLTGFSINPYGDLQPCLMTTKISYNLCDGSFLNGWQGIISDIRRIQAGSAFACAGCEKRFLCGYCPAFFAWEGGDEAKRSEFLCSFGDRRMERVKRSPAQGVYDGK